MGYIGRYTAPSIVDLESPVSVDGTTIIENGVLKNVGIDGIKLKSSGNSITKSDGTTAVLSESAGVVTLNNGTIGSDVVFPLDDLFPFTGSVQNIGKLRIVMGNVTTGSETDNGSASAPFRYSAFAQLANVDSGFAAMPKIFVTSFQSAADAFQNQFITLSYSGGNIATDAIKVYMVSDVSGRVASKNINYLLVGEAA